VGALEQGHEQGGQVGGVTRREARRGEPFGELVSPGGEGSRGDLLQRVVIGIRARPHGDGRDGAAAAGG
jgi:hypothetical protein